eukprot:EG_transcript_43694
MSAATATTTTIAMTTATEPVAVAQSRLGHLGKNDPLLLRSGSIPHKTFDCEACHPCISSISHRIASQPIVIFVLCQSTRFTASPCPRSRRSLPSSCCAGVSDK